MLMLTAVYWQCLEIIIRNLEEFELNEGHFSDIVQCLLQGNPRTEKVV